MWHQIIENNVKIKIYAKPNAKKSALVAISEERGLHIALHAKAQDGAANKELIAYLAKLLELPKTKIILEKGESSRHKQVLVPLTASVEKFLKSYLKEDNK